jgi:hypothetical protein
MTGNGVYVADAQLQVADGSRDSSELAVLVPPDVVLILLGLYLDFLVVVLSWWFGGLMLLLLFRFSSCCLRTSWLLVYCGGEVV